MRWETLTPAERWDGPPEELLAMSLHRERGAMVGDDVRRLPRSPLVVAEGSTVSPEGVDDPARAVWLLPSPSFQHAELERRGLGSGPAELYALLAAEIGRGAREGGMPIVEVDGSQRIDETVSAVERLLRQALAAGPHAETAAERRSLLREANLAIVAQVRAYYARPWATGDPEAVIRRFVCECGDRACIEEPEVEVAVASAESVLDPGHRPPSGP